MSMITDQSTTTVQVYQLFINATPEQIWDAITKPEFTVQYFHGVHIEFTPEERLSRYQDGSEGRQSVAEWRPPHRLVHEWLSDYDPELAAEEPSRVTWEIEAHEDGVSKLTVTHDQLEGAPKTAASVSGEGWMMVLSGLKTLVETGKPLGG